MVELGDDDLVARPPAAPEGTGEVEGQRRHVGAEGDLVRRRAEEVGERLAGAGEHRVGLLARGVVPMRVGVVLVEVLGHRLDDRPRHLGAAGAVEVGRTPPGHQPLQRGELRLGFGPGVLMVEAFMAEAAPLERSGDM